MNSAMSAIAAFCALNCAAASLTAAHAAPPLELAQLPTVNSSPEAENTEDFAPELIFNGVQVQDREEEDLQQFSIEEQQDPEETLRVLEVIGDRQEYDEVASVITAEGNVIVRFNQSVLTADQLQINLNTKLAIATGNVALKRGSQILRGDRFDYFFVQNRGYIRQAQGEVAQNSLDQDFALEPSPSPTDIANPAILLNERLALSQPVTDVEQSEEGISLVLGSERDIPNSARLSSEASLVQRVRFYAEEVEFFEDRWEAKNIRLTNDPFNPPELQLLANTATFRTIDEFTDELITTDTRLLIDDRVSIPVFPRRYRFDSSDDEGIFSLISIGFDDEDRGGFFIQRRFTIFKNAKGSWSVTPQYLIQKALFPGASFGQDNDSDVFSPDVFALKTKFDYNVNSRFSIQAKGSVPDLTFNDLEDELKFNLRAEQRFGNLSNPFRLSGEFNYRDRLFNGSLGFQRVQRSLGLVLRSPQYTFGNSGFSLNYQASLQNIEATTDRRDLLGSSNPLDEDEVNLTSYQGAVNLGYSLPIWRGTGLDATPDQGLRFSTTPVVPYLTFRTGVSGVSSYYSNGDRQVSGTARVGLIGQLGHFSEDFFDYTGFNISYTRGTRGETSPFLFDRIADRRVLSFGLTQQIYGPIRAGFQTAWSLERDESISTDYFMEYSRRTHSILIRYNPVLEIGSFNFKINDFNWSGSTDPFVNQEVRPVIDGVIP